MSIAPVARDPTFSPVSSPHSKNLNSFNQFTGSINQIAAHNVLKSPSTAQRFSNSSSFVNSGIVAGGYDFMSS